MNDDLIRSMREQMVPSDDVVNDLLAKIAQCDAATTQTDNVVSFEDALTRSRREAKKAKAKKSTIKSIWYYGTVAVAGIIVLVSAFSIFGSDNPNDIRNALDDIINNPLVQTKPGGEDILDNTDDIENPDGVSNENPDGVSNENPDGDLSENPNGVSNENPNGEGVLDDQNSTSNDKETSGKNQDSGDDKQGLNNDPSSDKPSNSNDNSDNKQTDSQNEKPDNGSNTTAPPPSPQEGNNNQSTTVDDGKVTPGAPGTTDISFNREILSEASVSTIQIQGSNYVVDTTTTSPKVSSKIETMSLEIPDTSTTKKTVVKAQVKKLSNVSPDLLVAVDVDGFKDTLIYANKDYSPSSLGQLLDDAGLNKSATSFVNTVYCKGSNIGYTSYQRVKVSNILELVHEHLFTNKDATLASYRAYSSGSAHVLFKSTANPTDSTIDFGVSDNGYLYVKMAGGNSFTFYIGESSASSFISSVCGR